MTDHTHINESRLRRYARFGERVTRETATVNIWCEHCEQYIPEDEMETHVTVGCPALRDKDDEGE